MRYKNWGDTYGHLGATPGESLKFMLFSPLEFAEKMLWPLSRYRPLLVYCISTGFACLFSPTTALVWAFNMAPSFLSPTGSAFHIGTLHYAAQLGGPFWWATAIGVAVAYEGLAKRKKEGWILIVALLFSAVNLFSTNPVVWPDGSRSFFKGGPAIIREIPEGASVWANEWTSSWLGGRSFLKAMPDGFRRDFVSKLFVPDYILIRKDWVAKASEEFAVQVLSFMKSEGYLRVKESEDLILYRHPGFNTFHSAAPRGLTLGSPTGEGRSLRLSLMRKYALKYLEDELKEGKGDSDRYTNLGKALAAVGRSREAAAMYEKAISIDSKALEAKNNLANLRLRSGDSGAAIRLYKAALRDNPRDYQVHFNIGNAYLNSGALDKAVASYKQAIEIKSDYAHAYSNLGAAYFKLGQRDAAIASFEKALGINPGFSDARKNLEALKGARR
jgi:tetratricopeptide (TPR) repeat protein